VGVGPYEIPTNEPPKRPPLGQAVRFSGLLLNWFLTGTKKNFSWVRQELFLLFVLYLLVATGANDLYWLPNLILSFWPDLKQLKTWNIVYVNHILLSFWPEPEQSAMKALASKQFRLADVPLAMLLTAALKDPTIQVIQQITLSIEQIINKYQKK
jgi:hypothetical protein